MDRGGGQSAGLARQYTPLRRFFYGRRGSPTQWSLAEALTEMEPGATGTMLYPSGVAAISCALLAVLRPGDEVLLTDSSYDPSRSFADAFLKRMGITANTWATSRFFPALAHGVDIAITAATKYIVGHSDVMMGAVTTHDQYWTRLRRTAQQLGQVVSPDDAYLAARGLRTLEVRLRQHETSALQIARWLKDRTEVGLVLHPAIPVLPSSTHSRCSASDIAGVALKASRFRSIRRNTGQRPSGTPAVRWLGSTSALKIRKI